MTVAREEVRVKLRIFNKEQTQSFLIPLSSVACSFALNEIPVCQAQLGLGVKANEEALTAAIGPQAQQHLKEDNPCQIIAILKGDYRGEGSRWDETPRVIFEGRINQVSVGITRRRATLNVSIRHWLGDLMSSSILYGYANYSDPTRKKALLAQLRDSETGLMVGFSEMDDVFRMEDNDLEQDIWANGIKFRIAEILMAAEANSVEDPDNNRPENDSNLPGNAGCDEAINRPSSKVKRAWQRILGPSPQLGRPYEVDGEPLGVPLALVDDETRLTANIIRGIARRIAADPIESYSHTDAWSKLINYYVPMFGLMVVPRVDTAIVAPANPFLRTPYSRRIVASDIIQIDASDSTKRPVRGVGLLHKWVSDTGLEEALGVDSRGGMRVACYSPPEELEEASGKTLFVPAPAFLADIPFLAADAKPLLDGRTTLPGAGKPGEPKSEAATEFAQDVKASEELMYEYAKMRYYGERLRGRSVRVFGRLRFDIAPGSIVEVNANLSQFRGLVNQSPQLQGLVSRVTINVDAIRKMATTSIQMQYTRTLAENELDSFTIDHHPLYRQPFYGCPLLSSDDEASEGL